MNSNNDGIRKAAILVASLHRQAADRLLDQMTPEQSRRVRQAVLELGRIDPKEQKRILTEFHRVRPLIPKQPPSGIELDDSLARKLSSSPPEPEPIPGNKPASKSANKPALHPPVKTARVSNGKVGSPKKQSPFGFLREAEAEKLARALHGERPQTIALVLSHLSPEQAGQVLVHFSATEQVEVVQRLVDLEETQPEILHEVERALANRLSEQVKMQRRRVAGLSAVSDILKASDQQTNTTIVDNLFQHDQHLAERLSPRDLEFADLARLDKGSLIKVLQAANPKLVMLALVGAPPQIREPILSRLSESEAQLVRDELDHLGPTRLSDVEESRRRIAELATRMIAQGKIRLSPSIMEPVDEPRRLKPAA